MFGLFSNKPEDFFSPQEKEQIVKAIQQAERQTNGEIRVFIESKCEYVNAIDRAKELFEELDMYKTENRNATLIYIAIKHKQIAVFGDVGIYEKTTPNFWNDEVQKLIRHFKAEDFVEGIVTVVQQIGEALKTHFPYTKSDKNELPDDIVFGN